MHAIVETLFDAVFLISVITIGILMIRDNKGKIAFPWGLANGLHQSL